MRKLLFILISVGSYVHAFAQSPYFYTQYGDFAVQNGQDIEIIGDEIFVCGEIRFVSGGLWNGYVSKFDEFGNNQQFVVIDDSLDSTIRRLEVDGKKVYLFGSRIVLNNSINDEGVFIKSNTNDLSIDLRKSYDENVGTYLGLKEGDYLYTGGFYKEETPEVDYWQPYLTKLDTNGNQIWEQVYEGFDYNNVILKILKLNDEELIFMATVNSSTVQDVSDIALVRVNLVGEVIWQKIIDKGFKEFTGGLTLVEDGIIVGIKQRGINNEFEHLLLLKYNFEGSLLWESAPFWEDCGMNDVVLSNDGYVIAGGCLLNDENGGDLALTKFDINGNQLWTRTYGFPDDLEVAYALTFDDKNRIIATGRTETNTENIADILLIKTNCMGLMTYPEAQFDFEEINETEIVFENLSQYVYPDSIDGGHYLWDFGDGNTSEEINPVHIYEASTAYEVTLTAVVCQDTSVYSTCVYLEENSLCCAEVEVMPVPAFSLETTDSLSISLENVSGNLYQEYNNGAYIFWDFGDGNTSTQFSPNHTFTEANFYDVTLSVILCGDTTSVFETVKVGEPVGIEQINNNKVKVYPNPATSYIIFTYTIDKSETVFFYNSLGQLIQEIPLSSSSPSTTIATNEWVEGIYYWQLGSRNGKVFISQ